MTIVAVEPVFIDTNVLVYASWERAPLHAEARAALAAYRADAVPLVISRQVIREFLATLARPYTGIALSTLIAEVRTFPLDFQILDETVTTTESFLSLLERGLSTQIHDTNIVASMRVADIRQIRTNNPGDFSPFAPLITVIPLV